MNPVHIVVSFEALLVQKFYHYYNQQYSTLAEEEAEASLFPNIILVYSQHH